MKKLVSIALLIMVAGCTTNGVYDSGKTWTLIGAVAVGGVAASQGGGAAKPEQTHCVIRTGPNSATICQ